MSEGEDPYRRSTDARGRIHMREADIDSFQEPVERKDVPHIPWKDLFPTSLPFNRNPYVLVVFKEIHPWMSQNLPASTQTRVEKKRSKTAYCNSNTINFAS